MLTIFRGVNREEKLNKAIKLAQEENPEKIVIISGKDNFKKNYSEFNEFWNIIVKEFIVDNNNLDFFDLLLKDSKEKIIYIFDFSIKKITKFLTDYEELDYYDIESIILNSENKNVEIYFLLEEDVLDYKEDLGKELSDSNSLLLRFAHNIITIKAICFECNSPTIFKNNENKPLCLNCLKKLKKEEVNFNY